MSLSDLPLDVGCTYDDVMVCTGVVVHEICVNAIEAVGVLVAVDVLEAVDVFEAVCVDVNEVFAVITSAQEFADGS